MVRFIKFPALAARDVVPSRCVQWNKVLNLQKTKEVCIVARVYRSLAALGASAEQKGTKQDQQARQEQF
jgi:hypothetical protein